MDELSISRPAVSCRPQSDEVISRIFARMSAMYGAKFIQQWSGIETDVLKAIWAQDLADYSLDEIKQGLDACKTKIWPPTLPEFMLLCRTSADLSPEVLFNLAQVEMRKRRDREPQNWPCKHVFWAAAFAGDDLLAQPYKWVEARWLAALEATKGQRNDPIPEVAPERALPAPGKTTTSREAARQHLAALKSCLGHLQMPA